MNDIFSFKAADLDKYFVGADKMLKALNTAHTDLAKNIPGYPPYNIVKTGDSTYTIELAVAGFGKHNLDIEMANNTLVIKGGLSVDDMAEDTTNPVQYLWKGIADRFFTRKFTLADSVEVRNAELVNGMLKIFLENIIPDEKKPKKVSIN